ncbi:MAG: hypothetical protein M3O84_00145 [Actinomycetota bacterium]|nr:hypothetical protein [Actinomycetota bacterium]
MKGAFVLRGADPNPHQVAVRGAHLRSVGEEEKHDLALATAILDVAPRRDVFVPFELSVTELAPGWYELECDLDIDGVASTLSGGKRFFVAWPRASVRRGEVRIDRTVELSDGSSVRLERADCASDSLKVAFTSKPPGAVRMRLSADGEPLHELETEFDDDSGKGRVTALPVLRSHSTLRVDVGPMNERSRAKDATVEIPLP